MSDTTQLNFRQNKNLYHIIKQGLVSQKQLSKNLGLSSSLR